MNAVPMGQPAKPATLPPEPPPFGLLFEYSREIEVMIGPDLPIVFEGGPSVGDRLPQWSVDHHHTPT